MRWEFKENHDFGKLNINPPTHFTSRYVSCYIVEVRCSESAKIRAKYQDRIPVSTGCIYNCIIISLVNLLCFCFLGYR